MVLESYPYNSCNCFHCIVVVFSLLCACKSFFDIFILLHYILFKLAFTDRSDFLSWCIFSLRAISCSALRHWASIATLLRQKLLSRFDKSHTNMNMQSFKEEYKLWKWGATAWYYASHTKTMFPMRNSLPRSSRQSDCTKTSWPLWRDANCSGMAMSPVHQVWPKPFCKAQWRGEEDKTGRGRGGKTTSGNGQAWSLPSPRGQWRPGKNGGNWLVKSSVVPQRPSRLRDRWDDTSRNWNVHTGSGMLAGLHAAKKSRLIL